MRRTFVLTMTIAAAAAAPLAAQILAGMPAWNSPKGGAGVTLSWGCADEVAALVDG